MFAMYLFIFLFFVDAGITAGILKNPNFVEINPLVSKVMGITNRVVGAFLPKFLAAAVIGGCWWVNQRYYKLDLTYLWYALSAVYLYINYRNVMVYKKAVLR